MAAELAVAALGPVIEVVKWIAKPIGRQFKYLCCFTSNINSLKDEAKKLDVANEGLQGEVDRARDNVQKPVPAVQSWLDDSKKINNEINGILNEAENVGTGCSKPGARYSLSKRAKKTTDRTKEHRGEKPKAEFQPGPPAAKQAVQLGNTFECKSRNEIEEDIMKTLRGGDVNMIGICGMGGLGKTTMAKKIMNRVLEEHVFDEVVIATVSHNVDISKIQDDIGGQLGLEMLKVERSQPARIQILHSRLSNTKRILLVLDDVWETLVLEEFGIPRDSKGCTILLTSRNRDVLHAMDVQIFGMEVLSEEEAWSFFREGAGTCVDDTNLNSIAKEIAQECRGLPIALKALGLALKDKKAAIWNNADIPIYRKEVYTPLILSYNFLDSEKAKSLFLLCCLFPEDANIPLEYLTNFCMGLRIFEGITNMEDARNKIRASTEFLKDRSLLLDSDWENHVRMHDVVRDVCTFIAKEEGYIGKDGCTWISSSHLVEGERNELLRGSRCPNLDLLFLDSRYDDNSLGFKFDDAFMEGMRELHVLCIEGYSLLTTLPYPTQSLGKLNTLILDSCGELETISVVGELVNLEILICRYCGSIEELPSEMKGLNRLKVLELAWCRKLQSIGRGIISSLVGLEELKMLGSFNRWEGEDREERENAGLRELEALTNLACLEIDIEDPSLVTENMPLLSKKIVRFIIRTDRYSYFSSKFSKAMSLCLERETRLGDWIEMQLLKDAECLQLKGNGANNVDLVKIQNIRWLILWDCESMKNVDATVFPSIERLELWSLPELQEICDGPISSTSFQNLNHLDLRYLRALTQFWKSSSVCENNYVPHFTNLSYIYIWKCDGLRNLGQLSMAGKDCLPHLEQLSIERCSMMEQVFLWNGDEEAGQNRTSIESHHVITKVFPKLKEVELVSLPNLTTFYQGIQGIEFPLLQKMKINECPKMKSIIGSSSADIDDDGSLHLLCQPQKISFGSSIKVLEINHNPFCGHEIPSSLFNGLEKLTINKYEGSMSLFTLSMAANLVRLTELHIANCDGLRNLGQLSIDCLPQLEQLRITKCAMMEQVFLWNNEEAGENKIGIESQRKCHVIRKVFPKLKEVELVSLPNLTTFYLGIHGIEFPLLKKLEIKECPKMKIIIGSSNADIDDNGYLHLLCQPQKVSFGSSIKVSEINHNPFCGHEIPSSLFNGLEELRINKYEGSLFTLSMAANLVSLTELRIANCDGLRNLGQLSMDCLPQLEQLRITKCAMMEQVFLWNNEEAGENKTGIESQRKRHVIRKVFPKLKEVELVSLPNLTTFYQGIQGIEFPLLMILEIKECPKMKSIIGSSSAEIDDDGSLHLLCQPQKLQVSFGSLKVLEINHNPLCGHEIPPSLFNGLKKLTINKYEGSMSLFTFSMAANLVSLRELCIENCGEMIEVIEDEQQVASAGEKILLFRKLEILKLKKIPKLVTFCDSKSEVEFPLLREVEIERCPNMESFSLGLVATPNLEAFRTDLTTYVGVGVDVAFNSLKKLEIRPNENPLYDDKISVSLFNGLEKLIFYEYKGSISLFLSSAVGNLVNLKVLHISQCDLVKVIEDEDEKEDGKVVSGSVVFPKLEELTLSWLPKLVRFCELKCDIELPSLTKMTIRGCRNMENFSLGLVVAPNLKIVKIDDEEIGATDLNSLLHQHYIAGREKEINEEEKK